MKNVSVTVNKNFKLSFLADRSELLQLTPSYTSRTAFPASFAFIESRRNGILVTGAEVRKGPPRNNSCPDIDARSCWAKVLQRHTVKALSERLQSKVHRTNSL